MPRMPSVGGVSPTQRAAGYVTSDPENANAWWDGDTSTNSGTSFTVDPGEERTETLLSSGMPRAMDSVTVWLITNYDTKIRSFGYVDADGNQVEVAAPGNAPSGGTEYQFSEVAAPKGWYLTLGNDGDGSRDVYADELHPHQTGVPYHTHD